jgi:hypothetical protein
VAPAMPTRVRPPAVVGVEWVDGSGAANVIVGVVPGKEYLYIRMYKQSRQSCMLTC